MAMTIRRSTSIDAAAARADDRRLVFGLAATALLLASAGLQFLAARERWVVAARAWTRTDAGVEDHRFDFALPAEPWENLGAAAQLFGIADIMLAAAVLFLGLAVRRGRRSEVVVCALAAAPFALVGAHALGSGLSGFAWPTALLVEGVAGLALASIQVAVLVPYIVMVVRHSLTWGLAAVLLVGNTLFGYLAATFVIAPALVGYESYDTTPWTEGVVAGLTAITAIVVALGTLVQLRAVRPRTGGRA